MDSISLVRISVPVKDCIKRSSILSDLKIHRHDAVETSRSCQRRVIGRLFDHRKADWQLRLDLGECSRRQQNAQYQGSDAVPHES
jgi:hypothetical protein